MFKSNLVIVVVLVLESKSDVQGKIRHDDF